MSESRYTATYHDASACAVEWVDTLWVAALKRDGRIVDVRECDSETEAAATCERWMHELRAVAS